MTLEEDLAKVLIRQKRNIGQVTRGEVDELIDTFKAHGWKGQDVRAHHLNKHLLMLLKAGAKVVTESGVNDFMRAGLKDEVSNYTNLSPLRYFGLIHYARDEEGVRQRGHWLITRNGWAFLRGELDISKWVKVVNNRIVERSEEKINVRDVYRGSEAIQTVFEYFDHDTGHMIGVRPLASPQHEPQQATLL